ncbi:hypothetical protein [Shimia ponticola]|uniref:hypothetical protein n=1 Tax=Shimia ponticola TaxID=2582893 RepID=UPI0011BECA9E|nr:hypothetical protein [Shimia ponticola]
MSSVTVKPAESGLIRVFAISVPPNEFLGRSAEENRAWLGMALGGAALGETAEVFAVSELEELGLVGYLRDGQGVPEEALAADRAKLSALSGWVAVVPSSAFSDEGGTYDLAPEVTLIGTYAEDGVDWTGEALAAQSAAPFSSAPLPGKKAKSDARIGGMVATAVLLFLAAFVVVFIWLAG